MVAARSRMLHRPFTGWLEERLEEVYKRDPGFSETALALPTLDLGPPQELPDALRGERWSFVQLPLSALLSELDLVSQASHVIIW